MRTTLIICRENAILVVTSSLEKMQGILKDTSSGPQIKKAIAENGRDVIVVVDKALKHPLVITGVSKFAKSKGVDSEGHKYPISMILSIIRHTTCGGTFATC
jgi:hypothetical protein